MAAVLVLCATEPVFFAEEMELDLLKEIAGDIAFALEYIGKAEQLDYLAYYDAVTGLANRMRFEEALRLEYEAARRSGRPLSRSAPSGEQHST